MPTIVFVCHANNTFVCHTNNVFVCHASEGWHPVKKVFLPL